jgi:hypothetical protein
MNRSTVIATAFAFILGGCAGKVEYARPSMQPSRTGNIKTLQKPREAVWSAAVPELSKRFFVINNLDKASGLINISYTGDPERFIDCGRITSYVKNARGERTYDFSGAKASQSYEVMNPGVGLFFIDRKMSLEGRVNLVFEEVSSTSTRVTANTRYVVARSQTIRNAANNIPQRVDDTISFNSGGGALFPPNAQGASAECLSTGTLEREILEAVQ